MIEVVLCSLVTVLPDFLVRRFVQGKRIGHEITIFSVWYELRWGITACLILTIAVITVIFYYHPTTTNVSSFFRTVTILPEVGGRVSAVHVANNQTVGAGELLFSLDNNAQLAAANTARRQIAEIEAELAVARFYLEAAKATVEQAAAAYKQAAEDLDRKQSLSNKGSAAVSRSEVDRLVNVAAASRSALDAAEAARAALQAKISDLLPARRDTATAALDEALVKLSKSDIYAGVDGTLQQFTLRVGDYVSPLMRPAGILVPSDAGRGRFVAGFGQLAAQVVKPGMVAEISCATLPFTIVPMVVTEVQNVIATGQVRPGDTLGDAQSRAQPGTVTVYMEPLYAGQTDAIPPGSKCMANAYTSNHEALATGGHGLFTTLFYHMVDAVGAVHAAILRIQTITLPIKVLVFSEP